MHEYIKGCRCGRVMFFVFCLSLLFDQYCFFLISDGSVISAEVTESYTVVDESQLSLSTKSPSDPTMIFFTMDYGTWAHLLTAPFHLSPLGGVRWTKNRSRRAFVCRVMGKYAWNDKIIWDNGIWVLQNEWWIAWLVCVNRDGLEDHHADTQLPGSGPGYCHSHP